MTETSPYTYKIVKLVNGEDIICTIANDDDNADDRYHRVLFPLKMQIVPKMVDGGIAESLNLGPWVHPYTESNSFDIPIGSVILVTDVGSGLSRYYEYVLRKINEEVDAHQLSSDEEIYDELLEELDTDSESIH